MLMRMQLRFFSPILVLLGNVSLAFSQSGDMTAPPIPKSLGDQFTYDAQGVLRLSKNGQSLPVLGNTDKYTLADLTGNPAGAETGIQLDFGKPELNGTVAYGPYMEEARYPTISYKSETGKAPEGLPPGSACFQPSG